MYAVVGTWYGVEGEIETWGPRFQTVIERVCSRPGFLGAELLVDHVAGKALARCLWESEEAMGPGNCVEVFGRDLFAGASEPTLERFEVVVSAPGAPASA